MNSGVKSTAVRVFANAVLCADHNLPPSDTLGNVAVGGLVGRISLKQPILLSNYDVRGNGFSGEGCLYDSYSTADIDVAVFGGQNGNFLVKGTAQYWRNCWCDG
ncbi:MAG: hypothetical protein LBP35_01050 [Candidatus Ancillula trichonymphae]|jgi:hypothetical protein|nr:hypothetical protein [Candidatus Ancillula trichonymphae]